MLAGKGGLPDAKIWEKSTMAAVGRPYLEAAFPTQAENCNLAVVGRKGGGLASPRVMGEERGRKGDGGSRRGVNSWWWGEGEGEGRSRG